MTLLGLQLIIQYGPPLAGLIVALGVWLIRRRSYLGLPKTARLPTVVGMGLALGLMITFNHWINPLREITPLGEAGFNSLRLVGFILPLALSTVALLFLISPIRTPSPQGSAELAPRTIVSFAPQSWLVTATGVSVTVAAVSVLAGLASSPDDDGRYVMFHFEASAGGAAAGATTYGWWFSFPCLVLIAVILALTLLELFVISRAPFAIDHDRDIATRTARVRNILAVTTGGLLLHLGWVLQPLHAASTLRLGLSGGRAGWIELGTSFAAMGPALQMGSYIAVILGFAMWWGVLLSAAPAPIRQPRESVLT
jgi:uncharacterized membrane protein